MYDVSAQGVDERTINEHHYYRNIKIKNLFRQMLKANSPRSAFCADPYFGIRYCSIT